MIVTASNSAIVASDNVGGSRDFRLMASRKAFEILSSQIYADPVTAVCRELGTNAADSHVMAGKADVPFRVHLPTAREPYFAVQDFGVGLTERQVNHVYTTYFSSDKTTSNDVTGCLGLGSKSPFAKTDLFQVTSVTEGRRRTYSCHMGDAGPAIAKLADEPTDGPTGVEVRFAVAQRELQAWADKAAAVYRWFKVRPVVNTISHWPEDGYVLKGDGYVLTDKWNQGTVVMGNVAYPVTTSDLGDAGLGDLEEGVMKGGPVLHVGIGDVDIVASREGLQYTPKTIAKLKAELARVAALVRVDAEARVAKAPTLWAARVELDRLSSTSFGREVLKGFEPAWNGVPVRDRIPTTAMETQPAFKANPNDPNSIEFPAREVPVAQVRLTRYYTSVSYRRGSSGNTVTRSTEDAVDVGPTVQLVIDDLPHNKGGRGRALHHARCRPDRAVTYLVLPACGDGVDAAAAQAKLGAWLAREQLAEVVVRTSTLPEVPARYRKPSSKTAGVLSLDAGGAWAATEVEFEEGGVYVEVNGQGWTAGALQGYLRDLLRDTYAILGLEANDVVGVRARSLPKFAKSKDWRRLDEVLADRVKRRSHLDGELAAVAVDAAVPRDDAVWRGYAGLAYAAGTPFAAYVDRLGELTRAGRDKSVAAYKVARSRLGLPPVAAPAGEVERLGSLGAAFHARYPLLKSLARGYAEPELVLDYVDLVDRSAAGSEDGDAAFDAEAEAEERDAKAELQLA